MGFLQSRANKFTPRQKNICETKNAPSFFARPSRPAPPLPPAKRRPRNGFPCRGGRSRRSRTRPRTRGDVAEADQDAPFKRPRIDSPGGAFDSEISWRVVFPLRKFGGWGLRATAPGKVARRGARPGAEP